MREIIETTPQANLARVAEFLPVATLVREMVEPRTTFGDHLAGGVISGTALVANIDSAITAVEQRKWKTAGIALATTALWAEFTAYHLGVVAKQELPERQEISTAQKVRGFLAVGALTTAQHHIQRKLNR